MKQLPVRCDTSLATEGFAVRGGHCPICDLGWEDGHNVFRQCGIEVWHCHWSACEVCGDPHPVTDADKCGECEGCPDACYCSRCSYCGDKTDDICGECDQCESCCECSKCCYCGARYDDLCYECDHCEHCCSCHDCPECGRRYERCQCERMLMGWTRRGVEVKPRRVELSRARFAEVDPLAAMADFYLLSWVDAATMTAYNAADDAYQSTRDAMARDRARHLRTETSIRGQDYKRNAAALRDRLVADLEPVFRLYVDIAVGGEIRHHRAIKREGCLNTSDRDAAWEDWLGVREQVGPDALLDAAEAFTDGSMARGYGGEPWAVAARILHSRLTDRSTCTINRGQGSYMPAWLFCDRVFTLQHNGGSLLNKVQWRESRRGAASVEVMQQIGNAHDALETDLGTLLFFCTAKVQRLVSAVWQWQEKCLARFNPDHLIRPVPVWQDSVRVEEYRSYYSEDVDYAAIFGENRVTLNTSARAEYLAWKEARGEALPPRVTRPDGFSSYCDCPECAAYKLALSGQ